MVWTVGFSGMAFPLPAGFLSGDEPVETWLLLDEPSGNVGAERIRDFVVARLPSLDHAFPADAFCDEADTEAAVSRHELASEPEEETGRDWVRPKPIAGGFSKVLLVEAPR